MEVGQVQAFQELGVSAEAVLGSLFCSAYHALACRQPLGEAGWILLVWPRAQLVAETLLFHVALASPQVPCVAARAQASSVRLVVAVVWVPPRLRHMFLLFLILLLLLVLLFILSLLRSYTRVHFCFPDTCFLHSPLVL